ncbi:tetratricopeptide repeat protein [Streptomyces sp. NPDC001070]
MDFGELERRYRTYEGWIPPALVSLLIERGHFDEVRLQAREGDWVCASAWARELVGQGRHDDALDVLAPFAGADWWRAVRAVVDVLEDGGRADEAIALARRSAKRGMPFLFEHLTRLLARHGGAAEAYELLRPHTKDSTLAEAFVDVSAGLGRDDEVAAILEAHAEAVRGRDPWDAEPWNAVHLLAVVRERQGRVDEAVALLRACDVVVVNGRDLVAELLVRHDRLDDLRTYIAGSGAQEAAECLADLLQRRGDVAGAVEALRPLAAAGSPNSAFALARLLTRNDRADEAIEVLRPVPRSMGGDPEWVLRTLRTLLADQGRAEEAFATIDDLAARTGGATPDLFGERIGLLSYCGRTEQAIAELRAHPDAGTWSGAYLLSEVLAGAGRLDEAIEVLRPPAGGAMHRIRLAELLIRRGRVKEAVAVLHARSGAGADAPELLQETP